MNELQDMFAAPVSPPATTLKKCPFCAEQIQPEATKCRYCGEFLTSAGAPYRQDTRDTGHTGHKWYHGTGAVIASLVCLGPLALPMVWTNPRFNFKIKIALTVAVAALTIFCIYLMAESYLLFMKQLEMLG